MHILITGGLGFIGSHLAERLAVLKHKVVCIDNFDPFYSKEIKLGNLKQLQNNSNITHYQEDIRNTKALEKIIQENKIEMVVHLAAKAGVRPSLINPSDYISVNIDGTVSVMEAMKNSKVSKLVFASSSSVYGNHKTVPFTEDLPFTAAISPYAATKQSGEIFTKMYHNLYQLSVINLRFFTVYGPRQRPDLAIHQFIKSNLTGKTITIFGDGTMARDYTYVDDTVQGIIGAIEKLQKENNFYDTYNLGNSTPINLRTLTQTIEKLTGRKNIIEYKPAPLGDVEITFASIEKAKQYLNYHPETSLESGLRSFIGWFEKSSNLLL